MVAVVPILGVAVTDVDEMGNGKLEDDDEDKMGNGKSKI